METRLEAGEEVPESRPASSKMRLSISMEEAAGACGSGDGAITSFEVIVILTLFKTYELTSFFSCDFQLNLVYFSLLIVRF